MISSVPIRRAVLDDLAAVVPLLAQLSPLWREQDVTEPITARAEQTWARMLGEDGRLIFVADDAGQVVATLDMVIVAVLTDDIAPTAIVMNIVVDHRHRGAGVGHALMDAAIRHARDARCGVIELLSSRERAEAHRLYRSLGFEAQAEGFLLRL